MHDIQHPDPANPAPRPKLTARERAMLDIEGAYPGHSATKEQAIRDRLGTSPVRYYQLLDRVCRTPAALAADPMLVRRVLRLQDLDSERAA